MKTRALISFAVTAKLTCVFVFAYAKKRFSQDAAHVKVGFKGSKLHDSMMNEHQGNMSVSCVIYTPLHLTFI